MTKKSGPSVGFASGGGRDTGINSDDDGVLSDGVEKIGRKESKQYNLEEGNDKDKQRELNGRTAKGRVIILKPEARKAW